MLAKPGPIPKKRFAPETQTRPRGRPSIDIDLVEFEKLAALQCTQADMAGWFGMHPTTLEKKLSSDDLLETKHGQITLRELLELGQAKGRVSVRRMQMSLLEKGNATMAIWLGKNLLGQSDDGPLPEKRPAAFDDIEVDD